jgi:putative Holliday junction resolvase
VTGPVIAIDPGTKRIGVAVSDADRRIALPLEVIDAARSPIERIAQLVEERGATEVIVGLPKSLDSQERDSAAAARKFARALEGHIHVPITLVDERLTSVQANRALDDSRLGSKKRRGVVDQVAATFLLQSYLDSKQVS